MRFNGYVTCLQNKATALHYAACAGHLSTVQELVENAGVDPDAVDNVSVCECVVEC